MSTIYELSYGSNGQETVVRYFDADEGCDCIVRLSEAVVRMDQDPDIWAAWASLKRLPDSIYPDGLHMASWTKTSDERPTSKGRLAP